MKQMVLSVQVVGSDTRRYIKFDLGRVFEVTDVLFEATPVPNFTDGISLLSELMMMHSEKMLKLLDVDRRVRHIILAVDEYARWDTPEPVMSNRVAQRMYKV